jgi:hypothetical protein
MSGPIVRRYGFPNFEKIFGERPVEHGVDEPTSSGDRPDQSAEKDPKPSPPKHEGDEPGRPDARSISSGSP